MPEIAPSTHADGESQTNHTFSPTVVSALSRSTTTLLRIGFSIGLASNIAVAIPPVLAGEPLATSLLSVAWCLPWLAGVARPTNAGRFVENHVIWLVVLGSLLTALSVGATGGFDSYLKTSVNWLPWIVAVLFSWHVVVFSAAVISIGLAVAMSVTSGLDTLLSESNRYTTISDLLNPWIVGLVALSLAGVFRSTFRDVGRTLVNFRRGDWRQSGLRITDGIDRRLPASDRSTGMDQRTSILTAAEQEIVELLASGLSPKEIAHLTRRRLDTVYDHIANAKRKYDTDSIAGLVALSWSPT